MINSNLMRMIYALVDAAKVLSNCFLAASGLLAMMTPELGHI